ncbi:hypothetical protein G5714_006963 [Onychostoma macrolepis]|uniref:Uncharacterized protein n=1 Tax=Onychostoma macrolepis TaxID=369639 RepID=A0A7J6CXV6_9TELE|nr:hypothetical protein G5714_006963 [Onychostoma macrolepis]
MGEEEHTEPTWQGASQRTIKATFKVPPWQQQERKTEALIKHKTKRDLPVQHCKEIRNSLPPAADRDAITAVEEEEEEEEGPTRLTVTAEDKRTDAAEKCSIQPHKCFVNQTLVIRHCLRVPGPRGVQVAVLLTRMPPCRFVHHDDDGLVSVDSCSSQPKTRPWQRGQAPLGQDKQRRNSGKGRTCKHVPPLHQK